MQAAGVTFVVSSHNMDDIAHLCQTVTIMDHGRSAISGTVLDVLSDTTRLSGLRMAAPIELQLQNAIIALTSSAVDQQADEKVEL